jgi:putative hydrolase of the HAD superfamily
MKNKFDIIAFDADDTLWHNETLYNRTEEKFRDLLKSYHPADWIQQRLFETQVRNLKIFGYGIKGFTLSMIESAIELTEGRITGSEIQQIIGFSREMLTAPIQLLDNVEDTIVRMSQMCPLMLITKGDLFDQESKIARSGLADYFKHIEIVSDKNPEIYQTILQKRGISPQRFLMIGNSLKSDILPVLAIGGQAVYIQYQTTWAHEVVDPQTLRDAKYFEIERIGEIFELLSNPKTS